MKSIKPGRGPSMMGGVMSIAMAAFGLLWTFLVGSMGGGPFALFGVIFIVIAIIQAVHHFKNATGENRYSSYDIVEAAEELDPLNERFGGDPPVGDRPAAPADAGSRFCPYCGAPAAGDYVFCNKCGRRLP